MRLGTAVFALVPPIAVATGAYVNGKSRLVDHGSELLFELLKSPMAAGLCAAWMVAVTGLAAARSATEVRRWEVLSKLTRRLEALHSDAACYLVGTAPEIRSGGQAPKRLPDSARPVELRAVLDGRAWGVFEGHNHPHYKNARRYWLASPNNVERAEHLVVGAGLLHDVRLLVIEIDQALLKGVLRGQDLAHLWRQLLPIFYPQVLQYFQSYFKDSTPFHRVALALFHAVASSRTYGERAIADYVRAYSDEEVEPQTVEQRHTAAASIRELLLQRIQAEQQRFLAHGNFLGAVRAHRRGRSVSQLIPKGPPPAQSSSDDSRDEAPSHGTPP